MVEITESKNNLKQKAEIIATIENLQANFSEEQPVWSYQYSRRVTIAIYEKRDSKKGGYGQITIEKTVGREVDSKTQKLTLSNDSEAQLFDFLKALPDLKEICDIIPNKEGKKSKTKIELELINCKIEAIKEGNSIIYDRKSQLIEAIKDFNDDEISKLIEKLKDKEIKAGALVTLLNETNIDNDFILELVKTKPDIADLITLKKRQEAVKEFEALINAKVDEKDKKDKKKETQRETDIQKFLEKNRWIFNLCFDNLLINFAKEGLNQGKYEMIPKGYDKKNIMDLFLKKAKSNSVVICELKVPEKTLLMKGDAENVYSPHPDLTKAVQQTIMYYHILIDERCGKQTDEIGTKKYEINLANQKLILLIGRLSEFENDKIKKDNFEAYRSSFKNLEIITYDELLEKAKDLAGMRNEIITNNENKK